MKEKEEKKTDLTAKDEGAVSEEHKKKKKKDEVKKDGVNLGQMDATLLQKVEELTLYMIDMQKQIDKLKLENQYLKSKILSNKY